MCRNLPPPSHKKTQQIIYLSVLRDSWASSQSAVNLFFSVYSSRTTLMVTIYVTYLGGLVQERTEPLSLEAFLRYCSDLSYYSGERELYECVFLYEVHFLNYAFIINWSSRKQKCWFTITILTGVGVNFSPGRWMPQLGTLLLIGTIHSII